MKEMIPGAAHWPGFVRNTSEQFEARMVMVQVEETPSIFFRDMQNLRLPVAVSHGEGRVELADLLDLQALEKQKQIVLSYVNNQGKVTERYPYNPNGSMAGITGLTSEDGRATIMMPHPERVFRMVQNSWQSQQETEDAPWLRIFRNARVWVD